MHQLTVQTVLLLRGLAPELNLDTVATLEISTREKFWMNKNSATTQTGKTEVGTGAGVPPLASTSLSAASRGCVM